jgi:CRISPR-associated protein Csd1
MLLQRLVEYSKRKELPPTGYDRTPIRWIVDIDSQQKADPKFVSTFSTGRANDRGADRLAPFRERTGTAIRPKLFADDGEYTFGKAKEGKKGDRESHAKKCHEAYLDLLDMCAEEANALSVKVVSAYLRKWDEAWFPSDFVADMNFTFRVDGQLLIDRPEIKLFWSKKFWEFVLEEKDEVTSNDEEGSLNVSEMGCHICGNMCMPVQRHPFKIKRIPNGQKKGNAIISANNSAFTSYGLKASLIAPTCNHCVEAYAKAANALLAEDATHITIGPLAYIFWTKEETMFSFASLVSKPQPEEVKVLMQSAFSGREAAARIEEMPFYATAFSASGSRVAVRDWLETTVNSAKKNLARWFKLQKIVDAYTGVEGLPFPLKGYLGRDGKWIGGVIDDLAPLVKKRRDIESLSANVPKVLLHYSLKGGVLPEWLMYQAINRNRAEQAVTRSRAAIIKMVLLSRSSQTYKEDNMECLDLENRNFAYLCGRLLGVLEIVQVEAFKPSTVNSTIVDRFYGTASSAPASVFGRLLRGTQPHLTKLRKEKRGTFDAMSKLLEEVQCGLTCYPKTLTLEEQGLFALGYYHQKAANRAGAIAYKQAQQDKDKNKSEEKER